MTLQALNFQSTPRAATVAADDPASTRAAASVTVRPRHGAGPVTVGVDYLLQGPKDAPVLIVQGGISAGRDVCSVAAGRPSGWWEPLVGPGRAIDTERVRVLSVNWLDAETLDVEVIDSADQADAIAALLDTLGIGAVRAFVGSSYGAMVGLAFAARHGARLGKLVAIAGGHRPHPLASAQRAVQRGILELGLATGQEHQAVLLARQLALTTYRGSAEFGQRFSGPARRVDGRWQRPVDAWLEHNGRKFAATHGARRYLALSQSIDLHDVDPASVTVPVQLIGIASDRLVPLADLCDLQRALPACTGLDVIDSPCGHDGFLTEHAQLEPLLAGAAEPVDRARTLQTAACPHPQLARSA